MSAPVKVCIRIRPSTQNSCITLEDDGICISCPRTLNNKFHFRYVTQNAKNRFDHVFKQESTSQVFNTLKSDFDAALAGRNLTVFGILSP